ncbi:FHF complex subunit HOOK interacting protein 1A isoform X2 [Bombina bombina]|uniref:FHF complex subunit HOOK interacting protein 1A isoform X2 n=1 Tax=Bombina bombina TaxID=8345 RepID=UPI00235A854D|nr:FHF complex subunit HOOK interacting protein 1A isoform X2 [Bombina bombina]
MSQIFSVSKKRPSITLQGVDPETCTIVFKNHWTQVQRILEKHDPFKNSQAKYGAISPDEVSAVQNYVEHMLFLLIEEQVKDAAMGPILEFVVSENIMEKLFLWSLRREFSDETKFEQLKMYELLVTQSHQPLLHHKPILRPLMMLLSTCSGTSATSVETELVVLLNQLCSILAKDSSILELFFHTSEDQGAANFLIFSLLIPFIHREGTVGQQARDALLFIMSLSAENNVVAKHIVESTYFCPILATGLSGLYSSLPTKLDDKGEEWHCLIKEDWLLVPALIQFMNSLEFCNAVIQVAHPLIRAQLVDYIYNGFLLPVMAPALHKVTVEEVMTTTAYLDLFLRSVSEPILLKIFLRFILVYQHENVHILDTLVSRINTPFRLCVVSLALFRTLISLHCEDAMLQLLLRYLIPCNHMMVSQRWAIRDTDCYSISAARFLALTPECCSSNPSITFGSQEMKNIPWSKCRQKNDDPESSVSGDYWEEVDDSYLGYLWEAHVNILKCTEDCKVWSAPYNGENPDPESSFQVLMEEDIRKGAFPTFRKANKANLRSFSSETTSLGGRNQIDLEWDDSYDTGISPESGTSSTQQTAELGNSNSVLPPEPPKHIKEMKKSAIMLIKGSYIEESDFQDDVMVYRLCALKDTQDINTLSEEIKDAQTLTKISEDNNKCTHAQKGSNLDVNNMKNSKLNKNVLKQQSKPSLDSLDQKNVSTLQLQLTTDTDVNSNENTLSPDSEDFIARCDEIINGLNSTSAEECLPSSSNIDSPMEDDDDDDFEKNSPETVESSPSTFETKDATIFSNYSARSQVVPFTGPFISVVLSKLENMLENSLHVNLLLIGIITLLATYPQPLIRSFLLNTNMVFQPSVRSLYQVLASVKHKIEQFATVEKNFPELLTEAQQYLLSRMDMPDEIDHPLNKDNTDHTVKSMGITDNQDSRAEHSQMMLQKNKKQSPMLLSDTVYLAGASSYTRNAVFAAVLFPEFLKELAALALEHSVLFNVMSDYGHY